MKFFMLILSCWMLYLACLPCGDKQDCGSEQQMVILTTTDHQQHQHETEHCTPFCACACCAVSAAAQTTAYYSLEKQLFEKKTYSIYKAPFCGEVSYAIWQPPKIF